MRLLQLAFITLAGLGLTGGAALADTIVPSAPEPASMTLLAVGVGGVALARKLRRRKK